MNENLIYMLILLLTFFAYKKYTQYKVLKLVPSLLELDGKIIDMRTEEEFKQEHSSKTINISLDSLQDKVNELDKTKPIILCCASGSRASLAKRLLKSQGFESVYNAGSWKAFK